MSAHYNLKEIKKQLRAEHLARRRSLPADEKAARDQQITSLFVSLTSYRYAETLLLYYPRADEIDTLEILSVALAGGKRVALPCTNRDGTMIFRYISSENDLIPGNFNIPEPSPDCEPFDPDVAAKGTLMILPGLAFDRSGYRLGYGKGYYDRYLENRSIATAGLIYSDFVSPKLPRGRYDLPVQFLVTEKGVIRVE